MGDEQPQTVINTNGADNVSQIVRADDNSTISNIVQAIIKVYPRSSLEELTDYLDRAVALYAARLYEAVLRSILPEYPYKYLDSFELKDSPIFFGRNKVVNDLYKKVLGNRLTVLHGKSGAGKTSLLNAGLSPCLVRGGLVPVYARARKDPILSIKHAIASTSVGLWPELLQKLTLHEFVGLVSARLGLQAKAQELVIILDQFEEFFVFWPERENRRFFIDALAECYEDRQLNVHFVISIRGDYFTHLAAFEPYLPTIFHGQYYLDSMTRQEAQEAIVEPAKRVSDDKVIYDQTLLDKLLDDLNRGGMELPLLQIICSRLYEDMIVSHQESLTEASYERLGRAEGVLGRYLSGVLDTMPRTGASIAKDVLKELVSSESTNRELDRTVLLARVKVEQTELDEVLTRLVNARLLYRSETAGEITYDLAHEYLIREVDQWIDQADREFKQTEELLTREMVNWHLHRTLIPGDRLKLLYKYRERFRGLNDEMKECLIRSALQSCSAVSEWAELVGRASIGPCAEALRDKNRMVRLEATVALRRLRDPRGVDLLIGALQDKDWEVRTQAAYGLRDLRDPRSVAPLIAAFDDRDLDNHVTQAVGLALVELGELALESLIIALSNESHEVRKGAAWVLWRIGDSRTVDPLIAALQNEDVDVRQFAVSALADLGDPRAVEPLIACLQDRISFQRSWVAYGLGELGDPRAVEPLITTLQDMDSGVRRSAAEALQKLGATLADKDGAVREKAFEALKRIGISEAVAGPEKRQG